jgi:(E)-4-hydroxy-3-methylbut-2-enyl-diphosphate synthase
MSLVRLHRTVGVKIGGVAGVSPVQVGGGAPIVVQSMTMTDTADARATAEQCIALAEAGSEMVRVTVNLPEAAAAVPEIRQRMLDAGCSAPLIGDFHYNGHLLLTRFAESARALDKYRINPGNVGTGRRRDEQFATICRVAADNGKPVRIGVNGGSLNQELVVAKMQENTDRNLGRTSEEILNECMVISAVESTALAIETGLRRTRSSSRARSRARATWSPSIATWRGRRTSRCTSGSPRRAWGPRGSSGRRPRWASCSTRGSGTPSASP